MRPLSLQLASMQTKVGFFWWVWQLQGLMNSSKRWRKVSTSFFISMILFLLSKIQLQALLCIIQMSKKPQKDKKSDSSNLEALVEQQKRQILQQTFTIKKLQDRLSRMSEEHYEIVTNRDETEKNYEEKIDTQRIVIENHESSIERLNGKIHELELKKIELDSAVKDLENKLNFLKESQQRQMDEYKKLMTSEMNILESQLKQYNHYMKERDDLYHERDDLKKDLQSEKNLKVRDLADKEREKVEATDKLKDEMLKRIKEMRANLLSLKKEQLSTTTRIAVLQNHQLTGELEFQSKQTEKLIFQNEKLQKKVMNQQKDLQVHKEVEEQLAKRSNLSKGIIKKLTNKINDLEQELKKHKTLSAEITERKSQEKQQNEKIQNKINMLDRQILENEKKYNKLQQSYYTLEHENKNLQDKIQNYEKKSLQLLHLLSKYYDDVLNGKIPLKIDPEDQIIYDIKGIKKRNVQDWSNEECKMVVNVLLNQVKNSLNKNNISFPSVNRSQVLMLSDEFLEKKLPKIGEHSIIKKQVKGVKQMPVNIGSNIVRSNLREWGRTVHAHSVSSLNRKYKVEK